MTRTDVFKGFINELKAIQEQIKELQADEEAIKDLIKEELTSEGIEEILIDDYKIIYRDVISNRFDTTNFKKAHSDLYKQFTKQTMYKRLTIN